jgi:hypothetical protein
MQASGVLVLLRGIAEGQDLGSTEVLSISSGSGGEALDQITREVLGIARLHG